MTAEQLLNSMQDDLNKNELSEAVNDMEHSELQRFWQEALDKIFNIEGTELYYKNSTERNVFDFVVAHCDLNNYNNNDRRFLEEVLNPFVKQGVTYEYWNPSVKDLCENILNKFKDNYKIYGDDVSVTLSEIKNGDAGNTFQLMSGRSIETNPWTKPMYNKDGNSYQEVRQDCLFEALTNKDKLSYTSTQLMNTIRLLMPQYERNVEVEDLNRNFWVISQVIDGILSELYGDNSYEEILKSISEELIQLWENILYLWNVVATLNTQNLIRDVHTEVVYIPNNEIEHWVRFNFFDQSKPSLNSDDQFQDLTSFYGSQEQISDTISGHEMMFKTKYTSTQWEDILSNRLNYLVGEYSNYNLCIIPVIRGSNYKKNYYAEEMYPGLMCYDRNSHKWGFVPFLFKTQGIEEEGAILISLKNESVTKRIGSIYETEENYNYAEPLSEIQDNDTLMSSQKKHYYGLVSSDIGFEDEAVGYTINSGEQSGYFIIPNSFSLIFKDFAYFLSSGEERILAEYKTGSTECFALVDVNKTKKYSHSDTWGGTTNATREIIFKCNEIESLYLNNSIISRGYYQGELLSYDRTSPIYNYSIDVLSLNQHSFGTNLSVTKVNDTITSVNANGYSPEQDSSASNKDAYDFVLEDGKYVPQLIKETNILAEQINRECPDYCHSKDDGGTTYWFSPKQVSKLNEANTYLNIEKITDFDRNCLKEFSADYISALSTTEVNKFLFFKAWHWARGRIDYSIIETCGFMLPPGEGSLNKIIQYPNYMSYQSASEDMTEICTSATPNMSQGNVSDLTNVNWTGYDYSNWYESRVNGWNKGGAINQQVLVFIPEEDEYMTENNWLLQTIDMGTGSFNLYRDITKVDTNLKLNINNFSSSSSSATFTSKENGTSSTLSTQVVNCQVPPSNMDSIYYGNDNIMETSFNQLEHILGLSGATFKNFFNTSGVFVENSYSTEVKLQPNNNLNTLFNTATNSIYTKQTGKRSYEEELSYIWVGQLRRYIKEKFREFSAGIRNGDSTLLSIYNAENWYALQEFCRWAYPWKQIFSDGQEHCYLPRIGEQMVINIYGAVKNPLTNEGKYARAVYQRNCNPSNGENFGAWKYIADRSCVDETYGDINFIRKGYKIIYNSHPHLNWEKYKSKGNEKSYLQLSNGGTISDDPYVYNQGSDGKPFFDINGQFTVQ